MRTQTIGRIAGAAVAAAIGMGASTSASAALLTVDQIIYQAGTGVTPGLMSGTLDVTTSGNTVTIVMRNTSVDAAFTGSSPSLYLLTGLGLQLGGLNILGGTVEVNGGSTALFFDAGQSAVNIANQYGYANQIMNGYSMPGVLTVGNIVSAVSNGQLTRFAGAPPVSIEGPNYGAVSALETAYPGSMAAVSDSIKFVLTLSGAPSFDTINAGNVVLAFGSPTAVPEPPTVVAGALLLLPFAVSTIRFIRKRRTA